MKDLAYARFMILRYLQQKTRVNEGVTTQELIAMLEENGETADRRFVYNTIESLKKAGYPVVKQIDGRQRPYYYDQALTPGEAYIVMSSVAAATELSNTTKTEILKKLGDFIPDKITKLIGDYPQSESLTTDPSIPQKITTILKAIHSGRTITFAYYKYEFTKDKKPKKAYRHPENPIYGPHLPVFVTYEEGRFYCHIHVGDHDSEIHKFRIELMERIQLDKEPEKSIHFDSRSYFQRSFRGYTGEKQTITAVFYEKDMMYTQLISRFPEFMINQENEDSFTVTITSSVTPTVVGWFMQYYDKVRILKPQSLIDELIKISRDINEKY